MSTSSAALTDPGPTAKTRLRELARSAMTQRGLLPDFSPAVMAEVNRLSRAPAQVTTGTRDLRALNWASIDNDDSRDLDQLSVAEALPDGTVRVLVAIADVDRLVPKGSAIDQHAQSNTTSVYTGAETFPMLPEVLSTDLTSLGEGEERQAVVVEMLVDADGQLKGSSLYRAVVRNHAKLAYRGVAAWLEGTAPAPDKVSATQGLAEQLHLQDRVAQALRSVRHRNGALSLAPIEVRTIFEGDTLAELQPEDANRAKELIEDFMIAANGATARYLTAKGFPSLRRVLRAPERWSRIVELASSLGGHLPGEPSARSLEEFLASRRELDPARFADLSLSVIKLLGSGAYAVERPGHSTEGHFGLAVTDYAHSTAPNRRYADLLTQRLVKAALDGAPVPYSDDELEGLAERCTRQADSATKVERQVRKSAAALLLASRIGERWDGVVTGASVKGTWVRVFQPPVDGKLVKGFQVLEVGQRVRVQLVKTDVEHGFIDFLLISANPWRYLNRAEQFASPSLEHAVTPQEPS